MLWAQALFAGLAVAAALSHGPGFDDDDGSAAYQLIVVAQALLFVAAAITVLRWVYFANANAHAFGAQGLGASPAMAVGSYFIPLMNLVVPFQSMREIWKASSAPRDWEVERAPALISWWWAFWIAGGIAGTVALRLDFDEKYAEAEGVAETLTTASDALTVAASLLLAIIIARVTAIQQARIAPA